MACKGFLLLGLVFLMTFSEVAARDFAQTSTTTQHTKNKETKHHVTKAKDDAAKYGSYGGYGGYPQPYTYTPPGGGYGGYPQPYTYTPPGGGYPQPYGYSPPTYRPNPPADEEPSAAEKHAKTKPHN